MTIYSVAMTERWFTLEAKNSRVKVVQKSDTVKDFTLDLTYSTPQERYTSIDDTAITRVLGLPENVYLLAHSRGEIPSYSWEKALPVVLKGEMRKVASQDPSTDKWTLGKVTLQIKFTIEGNAQAKYTGDFLFGPQ
eukprot:gnl/MRDRNA2_/MRDRNA2_82050_c0_seq1.p1 gnl/MRDRNA2_/MRDRNA2_82050_c0~~gnl/MRDRNA2_/MRDRNA2_82050_c0_seq1.p1  ORF type:complete len:136 (+),score=6.89 gnl/MRDRNA2_/MRDRNA2_82050_c0_seq1:176-583(+)